MIGKKKTFDLIFQNLKVIATLKLHRLILRTSFKSPTHIIMKWPLDKTSNKITGPQYVGIPNCIHISRIKPIS